MQLDVQYKTGQNCNFQKKKQKCQSWVIFAYITQRCVIPGTLLMFFCDKTLVTNLLVKILFFCPDVQVLKTLNLFAAIAKIKISFFFDV